MERMVLRRLYVKIVLGCILACSSGDQDVGQKPLLGEKEISKNVILLLASGMSFEAITLARIELTKMQNGSSSNPVHFLPFETLPHHGILTTYSNDFSPRNLESGIRTIFNGPTQRNVSCNDTKGIYSSNIFSIAQNAGKSTGLVTTLSVTSEIPAVIFGFEEPNECVNATNSNSYDMIHQIFQREIESKMTVIFGKRHSPHKKGKNSGEAKEGCSTMYYEKLLQQYERKRSKVALMSSISYLKNATIKKGEQALGLFSNIFLDDLKIMTSKAIDFLKGNGEGYFLVVIIKNKNVVETVTIVSKLIPLIQNSTSPETLLIVTSDHAELVGNYDMECLLNKKTGNSRRNLTQKQKIAEKKTNISPPQIYKENNAGQTHKTADNHLIFKKYSKEALNILKATNKSLSAFITKPPTTTEKYYYTKGKTDEIPVTISEEQSKNTNFQVSSMMNTSTIITNQTTASQEKIEEGDVEMPLSVNTSNIKSTVVEEVSTIPLLEILSTDKPTEGIEKSGAAHMEKASTMEEVSQTESIKMKSILTTGQQTKDSEYNVTTKEHMESSSTITTELNTTEATLTTREKTAGFSDNDLTDVSEESSTPSDLDSSGVSDNSTGIEVDDSGDTGANVSHKRRRREVAYGTVLLDIPIYASGPMASLFRGINKQDFLWMVMKKAICSSIESHNLTECEGIDHGELRQILQIKKSLSNEDSSSGVECSSKYARSAILIFIFSLVFNNIKIFKCGNV